jgi:hypothetical protein
MITVNVQGHGSFVIHSDKLNELIQWLQTNSMPVEVNIRALKDDQTLLNE